MADQLCTTAQVKTRLGITDGTDDALISELIDEVTDYVEDRTGRKLVAENAATYYVDTAAGSVIRVPRGIRTVTSLAIASSDQPDDGSGTYVAIAAADVLLRPSPADRRPGWPATRIELRGRYTVRLTAAVNGAKIVGDWGFSPTPPRMVAVAIDAVVAAYQSRQGASEVEGATGVPATPWDAYFGEDTPQGRTIRSYTLPGIG